MAVKTMMEAIRDAIREEMRTDGKLFIIGEDVGPYGGEMGMTKGLWEEFGEERVKDAPISEATIVGLGLGAALTGCPSLPEVPFSDFLAIAMDQIVNQAGKMNYMFGGKARIPMVLRAPVGAYQRGAAQHSQSPEAWFMHTPGIKVVMPSNPADAKGLLRTAIKDQSPVLFLEHKKLYHIKGEVPDGDYSIPFGKASIVQSGSDVTVVATAYMVQFAQKAAKKLADKGISCEIIDPRTLVPLDEDGILASVRKTGRLVVVHEAPKKCGVGAEIAALVSEKAWADLKAPVARVAGEDVPIPFSPVMEDFVLPDAAKIERAVLELMERSQ
jgi:pyruvate dehydrogenase E1 component beta subunit